MSEMKMITKPHKQTSRLTPYSLKLTTVLQNCHNVTFLASHHN